MDITTFSEPTHTAAIRDGFLDLAGTLIARHGVHTLGLSRRGRAGDPDLLRLMLTVDGQAIADRLTQLLAFGEQPFRLPPIAPQAFAAIDKVDVTLLFTRRPPVPDAEPAMDADGVRGMVTVFVAWNRDATAAETEALDSVHRVLKAWAYRGLLPALGWLRDLATESPEDYGVQMLASPHQLKESVTYAKTLWWNE